jgi:hypothetical protein
VIFAILFFKRLKTKETQKPPEVTMRKKCTDQVSIFDLFSNHDIGKELKAVHGELPVPTNNLIRNHYSEMGPRNVEISKKGESKNRV